MAFTDFHNANTSIMACQHDITERELVRDVDNQLSLQYKPTSAHLFGGMNNVERRNASSFSKKNYQRYLKL